jgi:uncharacterized protein YggE
MIDEQGKRKDDDVRHLLIPMLLAAMPVMAQPANLPPTAADGPRQVMIQRLINGPTLLSLTAHSEAALPPDTLRLTAGVVSQAPTAGDAVAANAARMNAVVAALRSAGVTGADIQTSSLSLNPQYRYVPNQPQILTGYEARNSVTVKTRKLGDAGKLIDALVKAGANEVNGPSFSIADPEPALNIARAAAVAKARARADIYAAAAGLVVKRIASISEPGAEPVQPILRPMMVRMAAADSEATPVEPGELNLTASVTMTFELDARQP